MKFRPRFSVRTLAIVVTLVCLYFGAWEATKKYGLPQHFSKEPASPDGEVRVFTADSPAPLIIREEVIDYYQRKQRGGGALADTDFKRQYYLWCGFKIKLPYESIWFEKQLAITRLREIRKPVVAPRKPYVREYPADPPSKQKDR